MPQRRSGSTLMFIGALLLAIAIFTLVMFVMGTRMEKDVSPDPASPQDLERQELAARTQAIADKGGELAGIGEEWTNALGGVWVPWPDGAPEDYTNPPIPQVSFTDVNSALVELSDAALGSDLSPVATSIGISSLSLGATEASECGDYDLAALAGVANTGVAVENIETARQWLEFQAAQLEVGARETELGRIDLLSDLLDAQLAAGAPDARPALVAEPENSAYVEAAYETVINQLAFSAMTADDEGQLHVASFICHLNLYADAPQIEALPGLDLVGATPATDQVQPDAETTGS